MDQDTAGDAAPERAALAPDLIIPALASALAVYYLMSTGDLAWEARATGSTIAWILLAMCAALFIRTALRLARGAGTLTFGNLFALDEYNRTRVALVALLVLFIATIPWLGTTLGLFCLLVASLWVTGVRAPKQILGISLSAAAVVYILFVFLLNSRMPRGVLEDALGRILPPLGS